MAQITYEIRYMCWHQSTSGFTDIIRYKGIGCDPSLKIPHKMSRSTFMYSIECYVSYVNGIVTPAQYSGSDLLYIKTMFFLEPYCILNVVFLISGSILFLAYIDVKERFSLKFFTNILVSQNKKCNLNSNI